MTSTSHRGTGAEQGRRSADANSFLVVNADDVGLCPGVHRGTSACVQSGTVTSISVLVGPDFEPEVKPYQDAGVSVGLHLNLTLGAPCAPRAEIPGLVDGAGRLVPDLDEVVDRLRPEEVDRELRCQLDGFRALTGRDPSHLDAHKHMHWRDTRIFEAVASMAREVDVPLRARDGRERTACRRAGIRTTDGFLGDVRPAPYWTVARLEEQLAAVGPGTTELMCHPGLGMQDVPGLWYLAQREVETATFCSARARELLSDVVLTGFASAPLSRGEDL